MPGGFFIKSWQTGCSLVPGSFLADELDLLDEISTYSGGLF